MNKDQFLNTGLLEQYALGLTSEEENKVVEQHLEAYPELRKEVDEIRHAIEQYALQNAIPPHPRVKSHVMSKIDDSSSASNRKASGLSQWLSLLSVLSIAAIIALLFFYTQKQKQHQQLKREFAELQMACNENNDKVIADQQMLLFMKDLHTQKITLGSLSESELSQAIAFWNPEAQKAYVNLGNLPEPPSGKQYQIWADVDHVMISVGLLNNNQATFQEIEFLADAESLNITIEPKGGSPEPTVEQLIVSGNI